jgi:hypothetical protein
MGRQLLQRPQVCLLANLPLLDHPLLRQAFQQRAPIEGDRLLQRREVPAVDRLIEGEHVDLGPGEIEGEGSRHRGAQAGSFGPEGAAQVGEAGAQAVGGEGLGALGPEESRQPGAFQLTAGAESEESEEGVSLAGAEPWERLAVEARLERPEEMQDQLGGARPGHGDLCHSGSGEV